MIKLFRLFFNSKLSESLINQDEQDPNNPTHPNNEQTAFRKRVLYLFINLTKNEHVLNDLSYYTHDKFLVISDSGFNEYSNAE